jgi:hypothetical protein
MYEVAIHWTLCSFLCITSLLRTFGWFGVGGCIIGLIRAFLACKSAGGRARLDESELRLWLGIIVNRDTLGWSSIYQITT